MKIVGFLVRCDLLPIRSHPILFSIINRFVVSVLIGAAIIALSGLAYAQTIPPRRLLEVADFSTPVVSPDGAHVAFRVEQASVERNTYETVWYVQALNSVTPLRRVADGGVPLRDSAGLPVPANAVWSADGNWIYYRALMDGKVDVWRAAVDGSEAEPVTLDPADVRDFSLSADGKTLMYSVGATRDEVIEAEQYEYDNGIRIDETVPIGQPLFRSGYTEGRLATQRYNGLWFDRFPLLGEVPDRWKVVELESQYRQDLFPSDWPSQLSPAQDVEANIPGKVKIASESSNGRVAMLVKVGEADEFEEEPYDQLVAFPSKEASQPVICLVDPCRSNYITGIQWRPNTEEVLFTVTDPGEGLAQSIFGWNVGTGDVRLVVQSVGMMSGGRSRSSNCGVSAEALVCVAAEADRPPRLERIDLDTGERHVLFDPNMALALDIMDKVPARLLRWLDVSGQVFTGQFFPARRTGDELPPLFVTYYSCTGFLRGGLGDEWPLASLAELGVSALCVNYVDRPDAIERYDQAQAAVESVIELLASANQIDRTKVGMGGLSFGSESTLWIAIQSDMLAAVSVSSPVRSPNYYLFGSLKGEPFLTGLRENLGLGAPDETPARWQLLSPAYNLEKIQTPMLLQMSEQEYIYALEYAIPLIRDQRADLYVFPNEPHQKFQPRHKLAVYERNLDWFRFWLQDYEDPDPAKREQYVHWRAMRARSGDATRE